MLASRHVAGPAAYAARADRSAPVRTAARCAATVAGRPRGDPLHRSADARTLARIRRTRALNGQRYRQQRPLLHRPRRQRGVVRAPGTHRQPRARLQPAVGRDRTGQYRTLSPLARLEAPGDGRTVSRRTDRSADRVAAATAVATAGAALHRRPRGPRYRAGNLR